MNREELPQEASREDKMRDALKHYEELATKACWHRSDIPDAIRAYYASLPPAEGAEVTLPTDKDIAIEIVARFMANPHPNQRANYEREKKAFANGAIYVRELAQRLLPLLAQRIADKMVKKMSPTNEQIHAAALAWARDHSEAPDKDCPTWLIRDYEAGAYFVRQCYGCWNKTDKMMSERCKNCKYRGLPDSINEALNSGDGVYRP